MLVKFNEDANCFTESTPTDWYENLKAHSYIQIEVGDDTVDVHAEEIHVPSVKGSLSARPAYTKILQNTRTRLRE